MKTIPLNCGYEALVDDEDFEELSKHKWYVKLPSLEVIRSGAVSMARQIMNAPVYLEIDHKDGNRLDNRRSKLRLCTSSQNKHNSRKRKKTSSIYKGVTFYRRDKNWQAKIGLQDIFGRTFVRHLGYFLTEKEAAKAYDKAARCYFEEFAALNFPNKGERSCL